MATGRRVRRFAALAWAGLAFAQPAFAQPTAPKGLPSAVTADQNRRVVAFFHGNVPVYREEFGEYLLARGGLDKVELLVNRRMIEVAGTRAGVSVTPDEIRIGLEDDLRGAKVDIAAFTQFVKERYGKSIFEWEQDVIRPRLLIGKMCHKSIAITPEEMQKTYETKFGQKRDAQLIVWPKDANSQPNGIAAGPDGALWFTEVGTGKIGRMTTAGGLTEYTTGAGASALGSDSGIASHF